MKIPIEWLKEYIETDRSPQEIAGEFTSLGLMLDKPISIFDGTNNYKTEVLDLEHRMDRSDWLSILGCARDLAAFENKNLKLPPVYKTKGKSPKPDQLVKIEVKCPDLVNRFNTVVIRNLSVEPSSAWLKNRLEAYGIPSINNVVDVTNYVMIEYGQPMHAQDLDKMKKQEIIIRRAKEGESVTTLLGEDIVLTSQQFVLTQDNIPTVIGGIVGGKTTGVDALTKNIILDAGNYNQINIRQTSRALKIQNETVLRYDKFLHPDLTQTAIERAVYLLLELAGGDYYENVDWYKNPIKEEKIRLTTTRLKKISGMDISEEQVKSSLLKLGYELLNQDKQAYLWKVPYFRTDVTVEDDLISDILRIYNYSNIPMAQINKAPPQNQTPRIYLFEDRLRDLMVQMEFHEHITDSVVKKDPTCEHQVNLTNALSSQKNALRTSVWQTLSSVFSSYHKRHIEEIKIYELGKQYRVQGDSNRYESYIEEKVLVALQETTFGNLRYNSAKTRAYLASLFFNLGIDSYSLDSEKILIAGKEVGSYNHKGFYVFTEILLQLVGTPKRISTQNIRQAKEDISLVLPASQKFGPIYWDIKNFDPLIADIEVIDEYWEKESDYKQKAVLTRIYYNTENPSQIRKRLLGHLTKTYNIAHRE